MQIAATPVVLLTQKEKYKDLGYGWVSDYLIAAAKAVNLDLEIIFYPPKRAIYEFLQNNIAFSLGNPEHILESEVDKSDIGYLPLIKAEFLLHYYKPDHPGGIEFDTFDDLRQYKINIHRGSPTELLYRQQNVDFIEYNDPVSGFGMLKRGRVDLVEAAYVVGTQVILNEYAGEIDNFGLVDKPTQTIEAGLIYKLSNAESRKIVESFKKGLKIIDDNGKVQEILHKYFGDKAPDVVVRN